MNLSNYEVGVIQNYFVDKPVLKAFLFGSFARNEGTMESDVDI
jgi:predicted nucleotidyltransferase